MNAQNTPKKIVYHIGAGPAIEGNLGKLAVNFTNELSYYLNERIVLSPSLTYFSSVADLDHFHREEKKYEQGYASSLFTNVKIQADILKTQKDFRIGIAAGPSFQWGGSSYHRGFTSNENQELVSMGYEVEKHARLGYVTQVHLDWKGARLDRRSSVAVSMSSFSGYWPYYLMATYRLGFVLK